jgi:hypothetical protein
MKKLKTKADTMEQLSRTLQTERNALKQQLKEVCAVKTENDEEASVSGPSIATDQPDAAGHLDAADHKIESDATSTCADDTSPLDPIAKTSTETNIDLVQQEAVEQTNAIVDANK